MWLFQLCVFRLCPDRKANRTVPNNGVAKHCPNWRLVIQNLLELSCGLHALAHLQVLPEKWALATTPAISGLGGVEATKEPTLRYTI